MNVAHQARKDLKVLASSLRGLIALDEELERAGSLEKLITETAGRLEQLKAEVALEGEKVSATDKACVDRMNDAKYRADRFEREAEELRRKAAQNLELSRAELDHARKEHAALVDVARKEADAITRQAEEQASAVAAQSKAAEAARDAAVAELREAVDQRDAARAEIARLKALFGRA